MQKGRGIEDDGARAPRWLRVVLAVPALAGVGLILGLAFFGSEAQLLACLKDDGYYYLTIARNIAAGHGATFDGLGPTNGFHPLWAILVTPIYLIQAASPYVPIRAVIVLALLVHLGAALAVRAAARRLAGASAGDVAGWLYAGNPLALWLTVSGMESPLVALCVALLAGESIRWQSGQTPLDRAAVLRLGLFGGLCALARTELVLLTGLVLAQALLLTPRLPLAARFRAAVGAGVVALVVLSPWLGWNLLRFGSLVQVSPRAHHLVASALAEAKGDVQAPGPLTLGLRLLHVQRQSLDLRLPGPGVLVDMLFVVVLLAAAWWIWSVASSRTSRTDGAMRMRWLAAFVLYAVGFVGASFLLLGHVRSWYAAGPLVVTALVMAVPIRWALAAAEPARQGRLSSRVIVTGYSLGMLALAPVFIGEIRYESGQRNCWAEAAEVVGRATPEGVRVASFNSGTFGYLAPRLVVNLDCVVNNRALPWLAARRLPEFVTENRIRYIVDDPQYVERYYRLFSHRDAAAYVAPLDTLPSGLVFYQVR